MPIYKINYTELWSCEYHVEARSKAEAESVFTTAIDRYIIRPDEDRAYDSSTWTTEEVPDSHAPYIDVSYHDLKPEPNAADTLMIDPGFCREGTEYLSQFFAHDYAQTIWNLISHDVARELTANIDVNNMQIYDLHIAISKVMAERLKIE